ncbi:hypothetical protein SAMN00790413_05671 [Deinococcus hopiensis KR-140]|uniref:Uncharacterized protein n=1 Tax=Deinococcus hopiensis KR-140 TaxID=695939 RepID=A0A1W1UDM1_9DEIO|nr:hypothetical protein SAMN00790413_05671 [Deinococcus hopiensis KR-140]
MLDQGRVPMRFKLFQELLFVEGCDTWRTSRRPTHFVECSQALLFQICINGFDAHSVQPGDFLPALSSFYRRHHSFSQIQTDPRPPTGFIPLL